METTMTTNRIAWTEARHQGLGEFQGFSLGSDVSIIFTNLNSPGGGPELHRHPYSETFIVRRGTVIFSDGMTTIEASAGQIVVVPPDMPHRFTGKTDVVEMIDIHASPRFITEWLPGAADAICTGDLLPGQMPPTGPCGGTAVLPSA